MVLCSGHDFGGWPGWLEGMEDLAGDIAFQTADDLVFRLSFSEVPRHVVAGGLVATQAHDLSCR